MKVLGIESTAHTLSIGVSDGPKILSNVLDTYSGGNEGLIPRKLADHHATVFSSVLSQSLADAKLSIDDIELIAFSQGPGIGSPLSVGVSGAKFIALKYNKKIIGVNHPYAHVKIGEHFCKMKKPLILYLSGGNSQILIEQGGYYHVLGETLDVGIGNLFDSFARAIQLEHAHGAALSKFAEGGKYIELPYTVKGMNLVFSGLLTQAEKLANKYEKRDVAFSLMETAFAMTCEVTERALFLAKKKELLVCGGVAQNKRLQEMLKSMCADAEIKFDVAPNEYNRDNGAMIAYAGQLLYEKYGAMPIEKCIPITNYRIDRIKEILG
ncbi:tRNA (adenosine(37)-N6)-threonylcarbamoyltransferase complex transferase subunit TsaD [Candidatus Micrarchaeota archaeon]|nr:tRNA (adenosine(37)-N6)-threonylcarbamoyltransferase complex transferase subunit TsaD [Candidatus Micrarchaeota archaeon]